MEATKNISREQLLCDMARTLRRQLAVMPDLEGNTHFCLNCWQPLPDEQCMLCCTSDYSVPILTEEHLVSIQWILAYFEYDVQEPTI